MMDLSRRDMLHAAAALVAGHTAATRGLAADFPGMIVRQSEPQNLEMPFASLDNWKTPTERFYVRSHFATPKIDAKDFKLVVEGHVANRLELTLDGVKKLGEETRPLTMECAGNGRVFLTPAVRGLQWGHGAVGNAEWTGVPLGTILERAKPKQGATEVMLAGADRGAITADPATPGAIPYSRSLPIGKAKKPEVMIAWGMNGEPLTPPHGAPLRAIVGGWFGMASVKWLTRIVVLDRPYQGYFQTMDYSYFTRPSGSDPEIVPVTEMQPKAAIARPGPGEIVPLGKPLTVFGAAWTGESTVSKVELSADGGATWHAAKLDDKPRSFCWVLWKWEWTPQAKGPAKLLARCTDDRGATQPDKRDADRRTYAINHLIPVEVVVR
jgi:DMSO/TMAO reductase YedYZ molybdopterin-dependent catalytic subunit